MVGYYYDDAGRLTKKEASGSPADPIEYFYLPTTGLVEKWDASLFPASSVGSRARKASARVIEPPEMGKRPDFSRRTDPRWTSLGSIHWVTTPRPV
jgi:hypothetical protein